MALTQPKTSSAQAVSEALALYGSRFDIVGDSFLFARLCALGSPLLANPLVEINGDGNSMWRSQARITSFGKACLSAQAKRIEANGIDEHIAGVHLSSAEGRLWFRDGEYLT